MTHTRMCQECPVSLEKLSFFFIQVKIIQVLVFDNWRPLNLCWNIGMKLSSGKQVHEKYTPGTPLLYSKTGDIYGYGCTNFFLILLQNIDCGYSLEPPRRGGLNVNPQFMYVCFFLLKPFQLLQLRKNLYFTWACFRNVRQRLPL